MNLPHSLLVWLEWEDDCYWIVVGGLLENCLSYCMYMVVVAIAEKD